MVGKSMDGLYEVTSGMYSGLTIKQVRIRFWLIIITFISTTNIIRLCLHVRSSGVV